VPAGQYVMTLRARDEYSGDVLEQREAFSVSAEPAATASP
jgi:hypothetical protein